MALLGALILAAILAYHGVKAGLLVSLARFLSGALAVPVAVGFAAPLAGVVAFESPYTYGASLLGLGLMAFLILHVISSNLLPDTRVEFPKALEWLGGGGLGCLGGLLLVGFISTAALATQLPEEAEFLIPSMRLCANFAVADCRIVAIFAPGREPISLDAILSACGPAAAARLGG